MMPRIPAILETLLAPVTAPSFNLRSPVGRSTTKVGAEGEDGEVNEYCELEACTFISRKGSREAISTLVALWRVGPDRRS